MARYEALLVYDDTDGALVLNVAGNGQMASGIAEGVNVETAQVSYAMDQRYSYIDVFTLASNPASDVAPLSPVQTAKDDTVPRYRRLSIICEGVMQGTDIAQQRGQWEVGRRNGRSQILTATVDNWRDSAGTLWTPNNLININIPSCYIVNKQWLISQVTFRRDARGTHADLIMMPKAAFEPQPVIITPFDPQLYFTLQSSNPAAPQPSPPSFSVPYTPRPSGGPNT